MENVSTVSESVPAALPGLPRFFELFGKAWRFYKKFWITLAGINLLPVALFTVIPLIFPDGIVNYGIAATILGIPAIIIGAILYILVVPAQIFYVIEANKGTELSIFEAYKRALKNIFSYLWIAILVGLVNMGGFLLLIIPGIFLTVATGFAYFVWVEEGKKGLHALVASWNYVSGRWWAIFLYGVGFGIILLVPYVIAITIITVISEPFANIIDPLLSGVIITPLIFVLTYHLFQAVKEVKSGQTVLPEQEKKRQNWIRNVIIFGVLVIPVIGILAGIVLASLSSARQKALEAVDRANQIETSYSSEVQEL